jgi:hypothetical protein
MLNITEAGFTISKVKESHALKIALISLREKMYGIKAFLG